MTDTSSQYDVIVVGAGFAGLAAAHALAQARRSVLVLEAQERPGGRARSVRTRDGWIDLGATWFWPNEPLVRTFAEQLGIQVFPQYTDGDAVYQLEPGQAQRLQGNPIDQPAWRFADGAEDLARRIAAQLGGAAIRYREPVEVVDSGPERVLVKNRDHCFESEHVILGMPPSLAADLIRFTPDLPLDVRNAAEATAVWMGGMVKAVALYDRPFWRDDGLSGTALSHVGPFREFHDISGPEGKPEALFGFAPSPSSLVEAELVDGFRSQLGALFGKRAAAHPRSTCSIGDGNPSPHPPVQSRTQAPRVMANKSSVNRCMAVSRLPPQRPPMPSQATSRGRFEPV